jgi:hypothetical protein
MTEICYNLQRIVASQALELDTDIDVRLSDFAGFVFKIGKSYNNEDFYRHAFKKLFSEQSEMALELDPTVDLLRDWIDNHDGQEVTTGALFDALKATADTKKVDFWYKNAKSFGLKLKNIQANLEESYQIGKRKDRARQTVWQFSTTCKVASLPAPLPAPGVQNELL